RPKAQAAKTTEELRDVLREMLKRLGESHFALLPREAVDRLEVNPPAKAEKGDKPPAVLRPEDRPKPAVAGAPDAAKDKAPAAARAPKADKPAAKDKPESGKDDTPVPGKGNRGDAGFDVRLLDKQLVVTRVVPDGPAAQAGVRPGWVLQAVNGVA